MTMQGDVQKENKFFLLLKEKLIVVTSKVTKSTTEQMYKGSARCGQRQRVLLEVVETDIFTVKI